jgi:hypothetical protein
MAAQKAGASRVEIFDPNSGRIVVTFANGSATAAAGGAGPEHGPDEFDDLLPQPGNKD